MQQSCSSLKAFHSARLRPEDRGDLLPGLGARRLELVLDQVRMVDAVAEAAQNFGSSAPQVTQPSAAS